MKKVSIFIMILMFGFSAAALANTTIDDNGIPDGVVDTNSVLSSFKTSKNVEIRVDVPDTNAQTYTACSDHLNGDREFGTVANDPKIYYNGKTKGTQGTNTGPGADWTSL